jgi:glucokinase
MILAGDVGGTQVNLALFDASRGTLTPVVERSYASREYPDLTRILQHFLKETQPQIAPEILPLLKTDLFLEAFRDKEKFRDFLAQVPVEVVMNKPAPLTGAAYFALGETGIQ